MKAKSKTKKSNVKIWSKRFPSCILCDRTLFPHKGYGYCQRCYPLLRLKKDIESWNYDNPESISDKVIRMIYSRKGNDQYYRSGFEEVKRNYLRQVNDRMYFMQKNKIVQKDGCGPNTISTAFRKIAMSIKSRKANVYEIDPEKIGKHFSRKQMKYLYFLLWTIFEGVEWGGINGYDSQDRTALNFIDANHF